jgi:uncharacterized membrane protein YphA (DoxX/SURF4 family)
MLRYIRALEERVSPDLRDLIFRGLFSSIFVGLGLEHLADDRLIQHLMPTWLVAPRLMSAVAGAILLLGGLSILLGFHLRLGARLLGLFLVLVTLTVHVPGLFEKPPGIDSEWAWLWTVFQRSNVAKNLCLLGVCVHLTTHEPGKFSLDARRR